MTVSTSFMGKLISIFSSINAYGETSPNIPYFALLFVYSGHDS